MLPCEILDLQKPPLHFCIILQYSTLGKRNCFNKRVVLSEVSENCSFVSLGCVVSKNSKCEVYVNKSFYETLGIT